MNPDQLDWADFVAAEPVVFPVVTSRYNFRPVSAKLYNKQPGLLQSRARCKQVRVKDKWRVCCAD